MSITDELKALDKEIKAAEKELLLSQGRLDSIKDTLKEMGVSVDKADTVLAKLEDGLADLMKLITEKHKQLKEEYEW